ncbi:hypothetical protein [Pedomonas mirosovicensis]|uniref:hypothetical protein n=1 Tax=Pedomonas mirosovicensis TaxID=2908641 RepID=UPI00216A5610|nr:hypothetical protein [Pedomonas mirosovicensis]MCH8684931.1 hypothetical protein [Pedomonas mirosovicensis]
MNAERTAKLLGWFSIGLGLAELLGNRPVTRSLGLEDKRNLVGAYGAREIATGVGLLTSHHPTGWMWGRVAGDALDVATLTPAIRRDNPQRTWGMVALASVLGIMALDILCARDLSRKAQWSPEI